MNAFPDLGRLVERLTREFPLLDEQEIRAVVAETAAEYHGVRVIQYVGIFVERGARERLRRATIPLPRVTDDSRLDA